MEERPRGKKLKRGSFWGGGLLNWNDLALEAADMQIWNKLQICSSEIIWGQRKESYDDDVVGEREADRKKCRKHFYAFPLLAAGSDRGLRFISRIFLFNNSLRQHCGCNFCRLQCNFNTRQSSLWVRPQCEGILSRFSKMYFILSSSFAIFWDQYKHCKLFQIIIYYIRCGSWPGCVGVTRWWQHGKWGWAYFFHF